MLTQSYTGSSKLADIATKVHQGLRLDREDGIRLYESNDLLMIGRLGNFVREKLHGKNAYFNVNRHIEP
ncbi:aminofutalosine synthase MqnE, partial [bacterium]|nr:aminofutalosine synthase MqnE [bacterium]